MAGFREYKIGSRLFAGALAGSMCITLLWPSINIASVASTQIALAKQLSVGHETGFNLDDPFLQGKNKPDEITLRVDPKSGKPLPAAMSVYVYQPGTPFPAGILHPRILGEGVQELSVEQGHITDAKKDQGAVFALNKGSFNGKELDYIEDLTTTKGWTPADVMRVSKDEDISEAGKGKTMFVREGCWWCHTLLPEETQDWQVFGAPPMLGDFNGESPTAFGSDRKAPDLLHVGSRNSSKEWMMMHFFNPRLVQPHSIMPRFDYLWGEKDASGKKIDYDKWRADYNDYREGKSVNPPEVPSYASDSDIRSLIDFMLSLK
ncbi:cbb3-type cytochrome c oxidase subunit II [Sideroxydans lithotrophicus]|uniref:Cytochrome C oxidase mono-heme subunit/FixO n=1 Tax=Sideroxydans lithotrophicus (strain ES-1) TaxID=580332 RepID=D5CNV8_SIDLE|nr:cbb3-type cytochrome c oxidase subunit II [Sideroxydans lithotrophicus]ADE12879.1 cytochrome C oxidase mono-heme subunit/FixO [Sideroxydans lithotrophicus ES-1]